MNAIVHHPDEISATEISLGRQRRKGMKNSEPETVDNPTLMLPIKGFLIGVLTLLIVAVVILSWVPPVSRDALTHHLAVPKLYLQHGGIVEIPSIVFSYYPMNLDLLYIIPLYFGNDIVPKFIHFVFALLTAGLIYGYLAKRLGTIWALFGAIFFLSLPVIVKLSITVFVDLGLIFFSTASIMSLLKWIESRFQVKFLILSGTCCGMALGTKYNGLVVFFLLAVFVPLIYINQTRKIDAGEKKAPKIGSFKYQLKAVWSGTIYCFIALLVFSPWMIRNYVWKGNPIYPLYHNLINPQRSVPINTLEDNGKVRGSNAESQQTPTKKSTPWRSFAIRKVIYGEAWWEIALIPVRIFFQGQDDNPKYFDGKLSPFLFFLPLFAFFQVKTNSPILRTEKKIFIFFTILYLLFAFSQTDMRIRYIAPVIPPLVILATYGLYNLTAVAANRRPSVPGWFVSGCTVLLVTFMLLLNASYILKQFKIVEPFGYILKQTDRDTYIAKYRPEYMTIQYANRNLPNNAKILALFLGNRLYYSDRDLIFGNNLFRKSVKKAKSSDMIIAEMQKIGFTHLLVHYDPFNRWVGVQFNDKEKEMLKAIFKKDLNQLFSQSGYGLFKLK